MLHSFRLAPLVSCAASALFACGSTDVADANEDFSQLGQPILGGTLDTEHSAVMLLAHRSGFVCTGTVIHVAAQMGYLLTAAHCVTEEDDERETVPLRATDFMVIPGDDFAESLTAFGVNQVAVEPRYEGGFAQHDIAIVRFSFGNAPPPSVIPPLLGEDDTLDVADPLMLVGFGQTETDEANTQRRQVERRIDDLDAELLVYTQADARGTCFGDSGGPGLVDVDGGERVAAVISGGVDNEDNTCIGGFGVSTRVSGYEDFIVSVLP
ncbi:MAG TPA: trypsin-like serine protease [Polyangiaceae bacterium]|nr:trypsin-like serine protease [Polyangiaceae bacterium]